MDAMDETFSIVDDGETRSVAGRHRNLARPGPSALFGEPGLGVALGSGGARGLAHVGVIQALLERGVEPDFAAGSSMGAVIGAAYAAGTFDRLVETLDSMDAAGAAALFLDVGFMKPGLVTGRRVMDFVAAFVPDTTFESLRIPFTVMATDLRTGDPVCISRGKLLPAIRASISIPGVFTPVRRGGALLVDGGVSSPVPVAAVRGLGAKRVLAVNVDNGRDCPYESHRLPPVVNKAFGVGEKVRKAVWREFGLLRSGGGSLMDVLSRTVRICEDRIAQWETAREKPDLVLEPAVGNIPTMDFTRVDDAVRAGREAAEALFAG